MRLILSVRYHDPRFDPAWYPILYRGVEWYWPTFRWHLRNMRWLTGVRIERDYRSIYYEPRGIR